MFFGKNRALYTLGRDEDGRIASLIRLSLDGIVRGRKKLSRPLHVDVDNCFGIACTKDKVVLLQPEGVRDELGDCASEGGSWVLDLKGKVIAQVKFDNPRTF